MSASAPNTICDAMERDGWTDLQVRALIAAHRGLLTENQELADELAHSQVHCLVHGDVAHGGEAEELRKGIETIVQKYQRVDYDCDHGLDDVISALNRLLDNVDARDSCAWGERHDKKRDAEVAELHRCIEELQEQVRNG